MHIVPTVSSNISRIGHDGDQSLFIRFNSGISYVYDGVPEEVFDQMVRADSVGKFFHSSIRVNYTATRLDEGDPRFIDFGQ